MVYSSEERTVFYPSRMKCNLPLRVSKQAAEDVTDSFAGLWYLLPALVVLWSVQVADLITALHLLLIN